MHCHHLLSIHNLLSITAYPLEGCEGLELIPADLGQEAGYNLDASSQG